MAVDKPLRRAVNRTGLGLNWWFGPAILYLDDIEEIYDLFERAFSNVTLQLDGYELDSPADAAKLKSSETRQLEIHSPSPYTTFAAEGKEFRFWTTDPTDFKAIGLLDATKKVVQRRGIWTAKSLWRYWLLLVPMYLSFLVPRGPFWLPTTILGFVPTILYFVIIMVDFRNRRRNGKVILRDSRSRASFRKENRDLLLVLLTFILTVIATIAAGVILYALGFVGNPPATPGP